VPRPSKRFPVRVLHIALAVSLLAVPGYWLEAQRVLTVVAHDTSLEVAPTIPAGLATVRLELRGSVKRELIVHRIPAGTLAETLAREAAGRPSRWFDKWSFGGPGVPRDSAKDASVTIEMRPGRYLLLAYEVDAAGRPRGDKYIWIEIAAMARNFLIPARFSDPDARIRVKDSRLEVVGVLRRGQRTLQVENLGARPHDLVVGRLKPGKTVDDVRRWDGDKGNAPFVYIGSLTPMSPDMTAQTRLVLQTGEHVVFSTMRHGGERDRDYRRGLLASFKVN
jgi:hypothetical protein